MNSSEVFGLWSIWQPPGSLALPSMVQQGFSKREGGHGTQISFAMTESEGDSRPDYEVVNGTAILELIGPLLKYDASWFGGTSTLLIT